VRRAQEIGPGEAILDCPTYLELSKTGQGSRHLFCSKQCFQDNWKTHKVVHPKKKRRGSQDSASGASSGSAAAAAAEQAKLSASAPPSGGGGGDNPPATSEGFTVGDVVTWKKADDDIPVGTKGKVVSFKESGGHKRAGVRFSNGAAFNLKLAELNIFEKVFVPPPSKKPPAATAAIGSGKGAFSVGDVVAWIKADTDIPAGATGEVINFKESGGHKRAGVRWNNGFSGNMKLVELRVIGKAGAPAASQKKKAPDPSSDAAFDFTIELALLPKTWSANSEDILSALAGDLQIDRAAIATHVVQADASHSTVVPVVVTVRQSAASRVTIALNSMQKSLAMGGLELAGSDVLTMSKPNTREIAGAAAAAGEAFLGTEKSFPDQGPTREGVPPLLTPTQERRDAIKSPDKTELEKMKQEVITQVAEVKKAETLNRNLMADLKERDNEITEIRTALEAVQGLASPRGASASAVRARDDALRDRDLAEEKMEEAEKAMKGVVAELGSTKQELTTLQDELTALRWENKDLSLGSNKLVKVTEKKLEEVKTSSKERLAFLEQDLAMTQDLLQQAQAGSTGDKEMKEMNAVARQEIATLQKSLEESRKETSKIEEKLSEQKELVTSLKTNLNVMATAEEEASKARIALEDLKQSAATTEKELESLKSASGKTEGDLNKREDERAQKLQEAKVLIESANRAKQAAEKMVNKVENERDEAIRGKQEAETQRDAVAEGGDEAAAQAALTDNFSRLAEANAAKSKALEELDDLRGQLAEESKHVASLEESQADLEAQLLTMSQSTKKLQAEEKTSLSQLTEDLKQLTTDKAEMAKERDEAIASKESANHDLRHLKEKLDSVAEEKDAATSKSGNDSKQWQQKVDRLKEQLQESNASMQSLALEKDALQDGSASMVEGLKKAVRDKEVLLLEQEEKFQKARVEDSKDKDERLDKAEKDRDAARKQSEQLLQEKKDAIKGRDEAVTQRDANNASSKANIKLLEDLKQEKKLKLEAMAQQKESVRERDTAIRERDEALREKEAATKKAKAAAGDAALESAREEAKQAKHDLECIKAENTKRDDVTKKAKAVRDEKERDTQKQLQDARRQLRMTKVPTARPCCNVP